MALGVVGCPLDCDGGRDDSLRGVGQGWEKWGVPQSSLVVVVQLGGRHLGLGPVNVR